MNLKRMWLAALVALALVVAACGPDMSTPTPGGQATASTQAPTQAATSPGQTPVATQGVQPTSAPVAPGDLPVDPNDWRTLGSADAAVTFIEYSEFQ
ncbi:MAG: hypothetical protein JXM73_02045 [Anaerolineae bacterium]|nr:hypothetical protein [Anaerolineae bacterium]